MWWLAEKKKQKNPNSTATTTKAEKNQTNKLKKKQTELQPKADFFWKKEKKMDRNWPINTPCCWAGSRSGPKKLSTKMLSDFFSSKLKRSLNPRSSKFDLDPKCQCAQSNECNEVSKPMKKVDHQKVRIHHVPNAGHWVSPNKRMDGENPPLRKKRNKKKNQF